MNFFADRQPFVYVPCGAIHKFRSVSLFKTPFSSLTKFASHSFHSWATDRHKTFQQTVYCVRLYSISARWCMALKAM